MKRFRPVALASLASLALAVPSVAAAAPTGGADAPIHPGVQVVTEGAGQCTANFVFTSADTTYLGMAAHCAGTGAATDTDGCSAGSLDIGTPVDIVGSDGVTYSGQLAYSSWLTMAAVNETDADTCAYNDFALVEVLEDDSLVNPSIPVFGGPEGIDTDGAALGEQVYTYGNSSLRLGLTELSPHVGTSLGTDASGWTTPIYTVTPGLPGDSGSAVLSQDGEALGILVTLAIAPLAGSNGVTSLDKALAYANDEGGMGVDLVDGTEPFTGNLTSVLGGLL